jgi:hypothetical protein
VYYPAETRVTSMTIIRRERMLPVPGKILVRMNDRVEPTQIVAQAELPGEFRIVPIASELDTSASRTKRYLRVEPGDEIEEGQVLAKRGWLLGRTVKSPIEGIVTAIGSGRILIEEPPSLYELLAYVGGTVTSVSAPRGLVIETAGAMIQGVWGGGGRRSGENFGVLKSAVEQPDQVLGAEGVDPSCHGMILVGGAGVDEEALDQAVELQVQGIVVGGLSPDLIPHVERLPFPVIATEGMGTVPMSEPIFDLLGTHDGRSASMSSRFQTRLPIVRPEIIIPLPTGEVPPAETKLRAPLSEGAQVRVTRAPHMGVTGTVASLPAHAHLIETGARVHVAEVDVGGGETIFVPLMNLEVLR